MQGLKILFSTVIQDIEHSPSGQSSLCDSVVRLSRLGEHHHNPPQKVVATLSQILTP